jgi:hypothetical protein
LYILVLDATKGPGENRLDYWLRFLSHYGRRNTRGRDDAFRQAPVLIVLNKCDEVHLAQHPDCPPTIDRVQILASHKALQTALKTAEDKKWFGARVIGRVISGLGWSDATEGHWSKEEIRARHRTALERIKTAVMHAAGLVPGLAMLYPQGFLRLKEWLEQQFSFRSGLVPWLDCRSPGFERVWHEAEIARPETRRTYLALLADLGIVHWVGHVEAIWRRGENDLLYTVFNPSWVKKPVYQLIQTPTGEHQHGCVPLERLGVLMGMRQDEVNLVRRLMTTCGIAFDVLDADSGLPTGLLIPDLLPHRRHSWLEGWGDSEVVGKQARPPFLPDRVLLCFIGNVYKRIEDPQRHCFRDEAVVRYPPCEVLVQSHNSSECWSEPVLQIAVRGGSKQDQEFRLLRVQEELDSLLKAEGLGHPNWENNDNIRIALESERQDLTGRDLVLPTPLFTPELTVEVETNTIRLGDREITDLPEKSFELFLCLYNSWVDSTTRSEWVSFDSICYELWSESGARSWKDGRIRQCKRILARRLSEVFSNAIEIRCRPGMYALKINP